MKRIASENIDLPIPFLIDLLNQEVKMKITKQRILTRALHVGGITLLRPRAHSLERRVEAPAQRPPVIPVYGRDGRAVNLSALHLSLYTRVH